MSEQTHDEFKSRLEDSRAAVQVAAFVLGGKGYDIKIPHLVVAPNYDDKGQYSDDGDLVITARVEVKRLGYEFTSRADWPFPDYLIGPVHELDRLDPIMVMTFNPAMTHYGLVHKTTRDSWYPKTITNTSFKAHDFEVTNYHCKLDKVQFYAV